MGITSSIVDELRHMEGIKGNFYVNETEYIAPATLHENGKPASQITYNSVKEIVQHHKHMFLIRFGVEQRIQEIEKGGEGRGEEEEPADLLKPR